MAPQYDVETGTPLLKYNFVLLTDARAQDLRKRGTIETMQKQKKGVVLSNNGLPVPATPGHAVKDRDGLQAAM